MLRTGLALEAAENRANLQGTRIASRVFKNVKVTDIRVSAADAKILQKPKGRYITIEGKPCDKAVTALLIKSFEKLLCEKRRILVAGLGNPDVTHDSLGAKAVRLINCGGNKRRLFAIETDVAVNTGVETAAMVRAVAREVKADCVLAIDALACANPSRIGKTVQLTDTGLQPGSGVSAQSKELTKNSLGVPVIAVGVPTVSVLGDITGKPAHNRYLVSAADEDIVTQQWAAAVSRAINGLVI